MKDLRVFAVGLATALTLAALSAAMLMWRDIAVLQSEMRNIQTTQRYYHGDEPVPKEIR